MTNLTGLWEGQYKYPYSWQDPVSFDAEISDNAGAISGIISEPNSFDQEGGHLLTAAMAGSVSGAQVKFTKTYVGEGRAQHSLAYEGTLSEKDTRITGIWKTGSISGKFEMTRLSGGQSVLHKSEEKLEI